MLILPTDQGACDRHECRSCSPATHYGVMRSHYAHIVCDGLRAARRSISPEVTTGPARKRFRPARRKQPPGRTAAGLPGRRPPGGRRRLGGVPVQAAAGPSYRIVVRESACEAAVRLVVAPCRLRSRSGQPWPIRNRPATHHAGRPRTLGVVERRYMRCHPRSRTVQRDRRIDTDRRSLPVRPLGPRVG
jgi:hypothetical protein